MTIYYNGYRIRVWEDDDTNHAQMLKGRKGPVRLYVDIDPVDGGDGRQPSSKRLSAISSGSTSSRDGDRTARAGRQALG